LSAAEVLARVADLRKKGERVYPIQKDVFRAFEDCPFEKVRVVILGQDPYANEGQAIGRAFAVSESTKVPRSLKNIFEEVRHDYPNQSMPKRTLESWAKQGVFLLNTTLTVAHGRLQQPRQHWVERSSDHSDLGKIVRRARASCVHAVGRSRQVIRAVPGSATAFGP
jgi:uracil-DNA glycosylase